MEPHQYVLCRGCQFFAPGQVEFCSTSIKSAPTGHRRGRDHHDGGTGGRTSVQPQLSGVGLPPAAAELSWSDLPAVFPDLDAFESAGNEYLQFYRYPDQFFS